MNDWQRKQALSIMKTMMDRPCSSCFNKSSIYPVSKAGRQSIKSGSSLSLFFIKQKLNENKYLRIHQWYEDVETMFNDIENQPNADKHLITLVIESRKIFIKEKHKIDAYSSNNWPEEVARLRSRISMLMSIPPPKIKQIASNMSNSLIPKPDNSVLSEHELRCFVTATEMMDNEDEINEINRILIEMQPEIQISDDSCTFLDVSTLSVQTINAIKTYMKAKLEARGLKYPT